MAWHRIGVCYRLRSPLHIGYQPNRAGVTVTARTRFYVPGRTIWGALTVALAHQNGAAPTRPDYQNWGNQLREKARFSHLFVCDDEHVFAPDYGQASCTASLLPREALRYGPLSVTQFRRRFVCSRMSTQVGVQTGSAVDQTLHETELLLARQPGTLRPVHLVGAVWFDDELLPTLNLSPDCHWLHEAPQFAAGPALLLGGDRCYGMGEVWLAEPPEHARVWVQKHLPVDPDSVELHPHEPLAMPLLGYDGHFRGERELLARRSTRTDDNACTLSGSGKVLEAMGTCLAPGTILLEGAIARLDADGLLRAVKAS